MSDNEAYVNSWVNSFVAAPDFLDLPDDEEEWIVRGLLRSGTYMVMFGREGTGKSRILYQLAEKLRSGGSWFGFEVEALGDVVFLQADMSPKESKGIISDASEAGILSPNIYFPSSYGVLDVLTDEGFEVLEGIQERLDPKLVIIDTATDVYRAKSWHEDVNTPIQDCVQAFRLAFPRAGLIFILHERKMSQYLQAKGQEDADAALGGGEWGRKASGVIRLASINDSSITMDVRKTRDIVPFKKITLNRTEFGFFEVEDRYITAVHALALWPFLGKEMVTISERVSVRSVCRSIEKETEGRLKFDALKKAYQRAKQQRVVFGWESVLEADPESDLIIGRIG